MTDTGPVLFSAPSSVPSGTIWPCPWVVAHIELLEDVGAGAESGVGLDVDLPGAAELVELIDVISPHVDLERGKDVLDWHLERLDLGAVDVDEELGRVGPVQGEDAGESRVGVGLLDQLVGHRLQLRQVQIAVLLGLQLEAAGVAQALDGRCPKTLMIAPSISSLHCC